MSITKFFLQMISIIAMFERLRLQRVHFVSTDCINVYTYTVHSYPKRNRVSSILFWKLLTVYSTFFLHCGCLFSHVHLLFLLAHVRCSSEKENNTQAPHLQKPKGKNNFNNLIKTEISFQDQQRCICCVLKSGVHCGHQKIKCSSRSEIAPDGISQVPNPRLILYVDTRGRLYSFFTSFEYDISPSNCIRVGCFILKFNPCEMQLSSLAAISRGKTFKRIFHEGEEDGHYLKSQYHFCRN